MVRNCLTIRAVLLDYGGVLATEGFRRGLRSLARRFGLDPEKVYYEGSAAVYESGYVIGRGNENDFWRLMTRHTGLPPWQPWFTQSILRNFRLRPAMIDAVRSARQKGLVVAILSDQTDWLDRLEKRDRFFHEFDQVFNSYYLGIGKKDPAIFSRIVTQLDRQPEEILFVDDNPGHVRRARLLGIQAWQFVRQDRFLRRLSATLNLPKKG